MRSGAVAALVVFALWLAGTAHAQSSDWPAPLPAQASAQQATTDQAGMTSASADDAQPTNIFVSVRVNSPGDDGPVTQTSTTAVAADTANDAATSQTAWQDWAPEARAAEPAPQASAQDSGTTQAAATQATATQPQPTNVVVSVRVNSPGDDGPVTQSSTVAVAAQSKNAAATAQEARQAQTGTEGVATEPTAAAPAPGAVADRPSSPAAPAAPASSAPCVRVAPGEATRIVITLASSCRHVAPKHAAAAPKRHATRHVKTAQPAPAVAAAPPAPVVHEASPPAVTAAPPASAPPTPRIAPKPRRAPRGPRPRAAEPKALDPLAAATRVAAFVAAAPAAPRAGSAQYEVMLALLLAMLGAAAVWSYGGAFRYRYRRWR
jgi:hypothetical protein